MVVTIEKYMIGFLVMMNVPVDVIINVLILERRVERSFRMYLKMGKV